jgi:2-dehydropantoate 2-reductase
MRIGMVGVGGVGGYFGGKLAHAFQDKPDASVEIYFVGRGDHLEAIQREGLTLRTTGEETLLCRPARATDRFEALPEIDVFLIAVKGYDLENVADALSSRIKDQTIVLPFLNGCDIRERLQRRIRRGRLLPGCVYISSFLEGPGVVVQSGTPGKIILGPDPDTRFRPDDLLEIFGRAAIQVEFKEDPFPAIWEKYIFIAGYGLVTACFNKPLDETYGDDRLREKVRGIMEEIRQIALVKGICLPDHIVEVSLKKAGLFPKGTPTSLQRDIRWKKGKNELDLLGKTILDQGRALQIPTPATKDVVEALLKSLEK